MRQWSTSPRQAAGERSQRQVERVAWRGDSHPDRSLGTLGVQGHGLTFTCECCEVPVGTVVSTSFWSLVSGTAHDVGVGADGTVWKIGTDPVGGYGYSVARWSGSSWTTVSGGAVRLDVDPHRNPRVVNKQDLEVEWRRLERACRWSSGGRLRGSRRRGLGRESPGKPLSPVVRGPLKRVDSERVDARCPHPALQVGARACGLRAVGARLDGQ